MKKLTLAILTALLWAGAACAQVNPPPNGMYWFDGTTWRPTGTSFPLPVDASVSASISGWPGSSQSTGSPISVTTGGVTGNLPTGTVVLATNDGDTNTAYCKLGASATVNDTPIYPHSSVAFTVGSATQITCITASSTTTVKLSGGAGLPTGWGGGSATGGGGGGGVITDIQDGAGTSIMNSTAHSAQTTILDETGAALFASGNAGYVQFPSAQAISGTVTVTQGTAANLNATVVGTGTFAVQAAQSGTWNVNAVQSGTWNLNDISGTISLPTGAATSANQTSVIGTKAAGTAATNSLLVGGVHNNSLPTLSDGQQAAAQVDASGRLIVNCGSGCGGSGGTSATDEASFTYGSDDYTPVGGVFNNSITALTSGQGGVAALTATRSLHVTPFDSAGNDMTDTTNHALQVIGIGLAQASTTTGQTGTLILGASTDDPPTYSDGTSNALSTDGAGNLRTRTSDPCSGPAIKTTVAISQTADTTVIAGTSSKFTYICSLVVIAGAAEIFNLIEGTETSTPCDTGAHALMGSTTDANGLSFAANGGLTLGNGAGSVVVANNASGDDVCIMQSGANRLSGSITYVQE